ncbi:hypothetical protein C8Q80DRAFT_551249 [Daedaleopsis nitida]|nr:hypothetical protein C8Q80DRAFT_551249 [Daedaleopsis nitida]
MSSGSHRKKPVCQKCGYLMVGHKRPNGSPVCPREGSSPYEHSPHGYTPARASELPDDDIPTPTGSPPPPLIAPYIINRMSGPNFAVQPSQSGFWHRKNPNWVDPDAGKQPNHQTPPVKGPSWVSTESESGSHASPRRALPPAPARHEVIDIDAMPDKEAYARRGSSVRSDDGEEYGPDDTSDTQSNVSGSSSRTILKHMSRGLSMVLGRGTPIASIYTSPREEITTITSAAEARGLYTRVVHLEQGVKAEPATPTRTTPAREHSWMIAVGRDHGAVNALADAQTPRNSRLTLGPEDAPVLEDGAGEPYDFEQGLDRERNERVGTYPVDPKQIRNTFLDTLFAGAIGGLVMFYCLSSV